MKDTIPRHARPRLAEVVAENMRLRRLLTEQLGRLCDLLDATGLLDSGSDGVDAQ
jgi:hypothetical protein